MILRMAAGRSITEGACEVYMVKTDGKSAFCILPLSKNCWRWLIMKAQNPVTGVWQYFVDKCLPFGSSISCSHFQ